MTPAADRPASWAGWSAGLARGLGAFVAIAAVGQALALAVWAAGERVPLGAAARIGGMYVGAVHHVAIELDLVDLEVGGDAGPRATSLSLGVAPLALTALAVWLLFRGGRAIADRTGGTTGERILRGATVAPSYALAVFLLALLVDVRTSLGLGTFVTGELHVRLSVWQALAFPLAIALAAGGAGGLRSALDARPPGRRGLARLDAVVAGGVRMLGLAVGLSLVGLFAVGVVEPDGPEALLTPSTARYVRALPDGTLPSVVVLGHHLSLAPNEAVWTLVPAMGGCDGVRGSATSDLLCYRRFPIAVQTTPQPLGGGEALSAPLGSATFAAAPPGYLLFLLVPLLSTLLGGRRAAERLRASGAEAAIAGACAGVLFSALVAALALLSSLTIGYGAAFGVEGEAGWVIVGPNVAGGALLATIWGVAGGAAGAAWAARPARLRPSSTERAPSPGAAPPR